MEVINYTTVNMKEDHYQVPLFEKHPIMSEKVVKNYEKVLSYSGLKMGEQISHRNVKIRQNEFVHQIYTNNGPHLPHLVFLHGFGGTSMTGIKLFKPLFSHFQIHALDIYGIGFSSRGNFSDKFTHEQVREYYVEALQEWRKAMRIDKFYLMGHSFGGYISSCYAFKYPQRIEHLYLVSPAGNSPKIVMETNQQMTFSRKIFSCLAEKVYGWNIRPSRAMNSWIIGPKIIKSVLTNRLNIPENEQEDWETYFSHVNSQCSSSQTGFYKLFDWPLTPKETIQDMIRKNPVPFEIDFYFGDVDWMPRDGAKRLIQEKHKGVYYTTIPSCGHQVVFDNSPFLCKEVIKKIHK